MIYHEDAVMKIKDAQVIIEFVGGKEAASEIVYGGLEPKENRFKWWDTELNEFCLVSISDKCVYTPTIRKALTLLNNRS